MTPTDDPFAPPDAAIGAAPGVPEDFFAAFWRWEKYRLIYNGVLAAETLLALGLRRALPDLTTLGTLAFYAILANVCFCAGPVLNGYFWRFGYRGRWVGLVILAIGTLFAVGMAAVALMFLGSTIQQTFILDWT